MVKGGNERSPTVTQTSTYRNEVVLWEATSLDVVLEQLLREVLVHLCCFMGVNCIPTRFVQIFGYRKERSKTMG